MTTLREDDDFDRPPPIEEGKIKVRLVPEQGRHGAAELAAAQAEDETLWGHPQTATEGLLQSNLRELHKAVERDAAVERCILDSPEDRLWHAADNTWWRRDEHGQLKSAEAPAMICPECEPKEETTDDR